VLSPYFFLHVVDDIVNKITECNFGCYSRNICTCFFLYADDIILLSPSVSGLQGLLRACEVAIQEINMDINASMVSANIRFALIFGVVPWREGVKRQCGYRKNRFSRLSTLSLHHVEN